MLLIDDYEQYSYTKITVPIILQKSPSDYDDSSYYLDIVGDDFYQEQCYIGAYKIEGIKLRRVKKADCEGDRTAEWELEMVIHGGITEEETVMILDELCRAFSLKFIRHYKFFQNCGFEGFGYDRLRLERKYAGEDRVFCGNVLSMYCGQFQVKTISRIETKVFKLPKKATIKDEQKDKLTTAFLEALKSKDRISRYILLYYLFEIMYETPKYQILKRNFTTGSGKMSCDKKRSEILFQYLLQEYSLKEYSSLGKTIILEAKTLERIILTRNDLTHRGDLSNVSSLMYNHLLPILREVIIKL